MLNKNRTLFLGVILILVLALYLILEFSGDNEKNYRTQLPELDTATITKITISPSGGADVISLFKKNGSWYTDHDDAEYQADETRVVSLVSGLNMAEVKSVAATSPENWEKFNITNETGTTIKFEEHDGSMQEIVIGKFDYIQPKNQQPDPYGRQPQGEMLSYVRIGDENYVYAIDGMIALGLGKTINDYRDKTILNVDKELLSKIEFSYPDDRGFSIEKNTENWTFQDGKVADSASVLTYINSLSRLRGKEFAKNQLVAEHKVAQLTITYDDLNIAEVILYMPDTSVAFLYSSQNPTNFFIDSDKKLKEKLFVSPDYFTGDK
jgi:hypothetical protein